MDGLDRIREAAKREKTARFTNLMHHITVEWDREIGVGPRQVVDRGKWLHSMRKVSKIGQF